jgi:hypothetical protein
MLCLKKYKNIYKKIIKYQFNSYTFATKYLFNQLKI